MEKLRKLKTALEARPLPASLTDCAAPWLTATAQVEAAHLRLHTYQRDCAASSQRLQQLVQDFEDSEVRSVQLEQTMDHFIQLTRLRAVRAQLALFSARLYAAFSASDQSSSYQHLEAGEEQEEENPQTVQCDATGDGLGGLMIQARELWDTYEALCEHRERLATSRVEVRDSIERAWETQRTLRMALESYIEALATWRGELETDGQALVRAAELSREEVTSERPAAESEVNSAELVTQAEARDLSKAVLSKEAPF